MTTDVHKYVREEIDRHRSACHEAMKSQFDNLGEDIDDIKGNVKSILDKLQNGSGEGLYIRMDRMERIIKMASKAFGVVCVILIGLVVNALWDIIFKGG